jgi:hypothetical protein
MRLHEFIGNITYILNLKLDYTEHTWLVTAVSEPAQYKKFFCKSVEAANNGSNNKWFTTGDVMREHPPSATDPHALENRIKRFKEPWYFGVYRPTQARLPCIQGTTNLMKVSILSPPPLASLPFCRLGIMTEYSQGRNESLSPLYLLLPLLFSEERN